MSEWYKTFFDQKYMQLFGKNLTNEKTVYETERMIELLDLKPGSKVLDLCCGQGRHSIKLSSIGCEVVGLDISEYLLNIAANNEYGEGVKWIHGDMRDIPFINYFDAVICMYTSFGYLETQEEHMKVLKEINKSLKYNGVFLLENSHRDAVVRDYTKQKCFKLNSEEYEEEETFDLLNGVNKIKLKEVSSSGEINYYHHQLKVFTVGELNQMLIDTNFSIIGIFGDLNQSPINLNNKRVVFKVKKEGTYAKS